MASRSDQEGHLTPEVIERVLRGDVGRGEIGSLGRHLLRGCATCAGVVASLEPRRPQDYGPAFERARRRARAATQRRRIEAVRAESTLAMVLAQPPSRRRKRVLACADCHTPGFVHLLLREADTAGGRDPADAAALAELAVAASNWLSIDAYGGTAVEDHRVQARIGLANALRIAEKHGEALALLHPLLVEREPANPLDPVLRASALSALASVHSDLGRFEKSAVVLDEALDIARRLGMRQLEAKVLIQQAIALCWVGSDEALEKVELGLALIDASSDPRLVLCGRHAQVLSLVNLNRADEAVRLFLLCDGLYKQFPDTMTQLRRRWAAGLILQGLGLNPEAVKVFSNVRGHFSRREMHQEVALISADLARSQFVMGNLEAATATLGEILPLLARLGLAHDVQAVAAMAREALETRSAEIATFLHLAEALRRRWRSRQETGSRYPASI